MIWHILGAGSLGCLWAARLTQRGFNTQLVLRSQASLNRYLELGAQLRFQGFQQDTAQSISIPAQLADELQPITNLILACKAYDAVSAIQSIQHRLAQDCQLFLLQNGMGSQQRIQSELPTCRVMAASTTEGAFSTKPFHCTHAGQGTTLIGDLGEKQLPSFALKLWQRAHIDCQWSDDIWAALWRKLAINCMVNPLTVLHQCKNGELLQHTNRLATLADELAELLSAQGYPCDSSEIFALAQQVIQNTAQNTSSMLQDVQARRRTEISFITGFALEQSRLADTRHTVLQQLHEQLQQHLFALDLPVD